MFFFAFCFERYILKLAATDGGVVVSNDNYRDLINESPEFKEVIEKRLLMFSFVPGAAGKPDRCVSLPRLFPNSHTPPSPASACLNLKLKTSPSCIISCGYFYLKFLKTWVLSHECKLQTKRGWLVQFHKKSIMRHSVDVCSLCGVRDWLICIFSLFTSRNFKLTTSRLLPVVYADVYYC